jgi:hypothetical protein
MSARRLRVLCAVAMALLACGCSTLPDSGTVHTRPADAQATTNQVYDFRPAGPSDGDDRDSIVRGFLLAMQANPPSTSVARSFLSDRAKGTWNPNEGTIVYDASTLDTVDGRVVARLRGAHRLSPSGAWLGGTAATTTTLRLTLVQEDGQWRIDNPPNVLAVPASYFSSLFVPFDLYFFDRTGTVLLPSRVYVPRGEQTATNLVRGLLAGPPPDRRAAVSAFPAAVNLDDVAVVVNDAGIAEVPLGAAVLDLTPARLSRAVAQLGWTLRQVPGINRLRITVDGAPLPLADGQTDERVGVGVDYDPLVSAQRDLVAISDGRVVVDDGNRGTPVGGPFGEQGFALRSLAWSARSHSLAAVSANGRRVFVAPDRGSRAAGRVETALDGATDVLRPTFDRFRGLWLVDNTLGGAVVHLIRNGHDRIIEVPGVSRARISAFTVTSDGATFVAVLASGANPTVLASDLVRAGGGRVQRATPARTLQVSGVDLGPARDVVQNGATTVAVLTRPADGADQVVSVELDGSPTLPGLPGSGDPDPLPDTVPGALSSLVSSPDPALLLRVVGTDRHLYTFTDSGRWVRAAMTGVVAAAYSG